MQEIINLVNEMSPYLLLGFFLAGVMHAFVPGIVYHRYLGGKGFRSVFYGALLGVPLPLCSCGVIPTAMSLRKEGASKGATTSFLIATPETGVDSIIATYSLLGLPFAILRPIAAFCNAILGGWLINKFDTDTASVAISEAETKCSCGCGEGKMPATFMGKMREALKFGFVEMMEDIGRWLLVGLIVAGLITVFVPDEFFAMFRGNTQLSMLLVLCIAIPMYICATGSIPIAVALMLKGLTPGAALVLLMAGPACNMASILVIKKVMGNKSLALYLASIITMAIFWGHVVDYVLPMEWFQAGVLDAVCCHEEGTEWFNIACTIVLALLLINAFFFSKGHCHGHNHAEEHDHCHCHEHDDDCHCHEHDHNHDHNHEHGHCCCHNYHEENNNSTSKHTTIKTYRIEGMNCNHCRAAAEKAIQSVAGVTHVTVDLHNKEAYVEGTALPEDICKAIEEVGFTCKL